ncbi:bifunctional tetrahydrofolate synthase/dihydrofolate synthase [Aquimonas voraii]|uniref:Dihydrofolate synthase/folylpolyglutamate synthase n=1 Tax=Aquimonas voraii TaxID=265719 RepID=A0A1G6YB25_9GAMM|nr:bifunctional tetrahydrofolate synthase/dihydrofolate synthase [Aquimonas voraii]SDD87461.1 dihydrofolate synthase / folylpolyglutamate synthase [Aquimonas voraii]
MDVAAWLDHQLRLHPKNIEMGLERVRPVAQTLGVLRPAARVLTVAGTNGKGSTVAMLEAACLAAGLRCGAYTSPHIERYHERIRIHGREVEDADLIAAFEAVEAARAGVPLTFFEFGTLAALWLFARAGLDVAVLEVGLGGRLDAVNLVDADIALLTTVDLDHMDWLGPTREHIGREKAGVFRSGRPAVIGEREPPASVLERAREIGARLERRGLDFDVEAHAEGLSYRDAQGALQLPHPQLSAPAQFDNAALAARALRLLGLTEAAIAAGIANAAPRARLQRIAGVPEIVLDVGHNPQAARQLADWLDAHPKPTVAVFAALADKDIEGVVAPLRHAITRWHLAGLDVAGRSQSAEALAARIRDAAPDPILHVHADVDAALRAAVAEASPDSRVLVFGSFHTVGEAFACLRQLGRLPE